MSQALHLRHLANRPCISMLVTKFSQNIVSDTDKNKALIDCHKCSSSFLSIVKSHPIKIPASVLEKVRSGSCLKLFLIDCKARDRRASPSLDGWYMMVWMISDGHMKPVTNVARISWHLCYGWGNTPKNLNQDIDPTGDQTRASCLRSMVTMLPLDHCSFSNLSVTTPTSQLILQPFHRFTYVTAHSPTLPLLHLRHSPFSNPSFASPASQALHLIHLANRPCLWTF